MDELLAQLRADLDKHDIVARDAFTQGLEEGDLTRPGEAMMLVLLGSLALTDAEQDIERVKGMAAEQQRLLNLAPDYRQLLDVASELSQLTQERQRTMRRIINANKGLVARVGELEAHLRAERELRRRAQDRAESAAALPAAAAATPAGESERLQAQLADALADRDLFEQLVEVAEDERDTAIAARATLYAQLLALNPDVADADLRTDDDDDDACFADILNAAKHPQLVLTLDYAAAEQLDCHPKATAWRRRTRAALHTLAAYAEARSDATTTAGDLYTFVREGGPHVRISAATLAVGESRRVVTNPKLAAERVFPVPEEVDAAGAAPMYAHIRIGSGQPPAPRLHFLDDTARTGLVVVGYLGPHLTNTKTN